LATRKYVDPNQAVYDGVLAHVPENFFSGAAFEIPGAVGEVLGSRRAQTREQPVTKTLEVEQPKVEGLSEKKSLKAAIRIKDTGQILTGRIHAEAYTNAGLDPGQFKEGEVEDGWVDENGKFLTYKEGAKRQGITALKPGEKVPEQQEFQFTPVHESDQWLSSVANRFTQERAARGEFDEVAPGQGYATEDLLAMGSRMKPEEVAQHVSNLVNGVGGDPVRQAAAVRAREAQLAAASNRASRVWEDDPANMEKKAAADEARDALSQFHAGPIAKMKNQWHGIGMSMQGELPFDLGTFNGQRDKWLKEVGSEPSPKVQEKMRKMAKDVRDTDAEQRAAQEDLGREIQRQPGKSRISEADLHKYLDDILKDLPCREE